MRGQISTMPFANRCHLGYGSPLSNAGPFDPVQVPNLVALWDAKQYTTIDLGSTLLASGTTPPVVTISGTPNRIACLRIEVRSSTTFDWTNNNIGTGALGGTFEGGTNVTIPNGSSIALSNGLTVNFAAGTYASNNVYQATIANWRSRVVSTDVLAQATATQQPRYLIDSTTGFPFSRADGTDDELFCSTIDRPLTGTTPTWIYGIVRIDTWSNFKSLIGAGDTSGYTLAINCITATPQVCMTNGANVNTISPTLAAFKELECHFKNSTAGHTGTDPTAWGDYLKIGSVVGAGAAGGGSNPAAGITLHSDHRSGTYSATSWPLVAVFSSIPNQQNLALLQQYASDYWAASVLT